MRNGDKIKVNCPSCKSTLTLDYTPDIGAKMLTCPVCGMRAKVSVFQQLGQGAGAGTKGTKETEDTEVTELLSYHKDDTIGSLYIGRTEYPLRKGRNTIGRLAINTGTADIQLKNNDGTVDRYMSRNHAVITTSKGSRNTEHLLESANKHNLITVNGKPILLGDIVALQWGDRLVFGHTPVLFQRPGYSV